MNSPYYAPSGRLPAQAIVAAAACALFVAIPAWLYAWLTFHSPLVLLNWLAMCVFAAVMGAAARLAARQGKARTPLWMGCLGLAIGIAGWYAHWAAWFAIADVGGFTSLLGDPHAMWSYAMLLAGSEVRGIMGIQLDSSVLVAGWIVEFILLTSLPRSLARASAEEPFCESTNSWVTPCELPRKFAWIDEPDIAVHRLETAPGELFAVLGECRETAPARYSTVTLYRGAGDPFVSIDNVMIGHDGRQEKKTRHPVIAYLRLPGMDAEWIAARCTAAAAEAQAGPAAGSGADAGSNTGSATGSDNRQAPADPPELVEAIAHLAAGRFEETLAGAMPHTEAAQDQLRIDAIRLCAMASAQLGRWDDAQRYWNALCSEEPSVFNALQTGCNYVMIGETSRGEEWIAWARERNADSHEIPDTQIVTSFISALTQSGQPARAMPYLDAMRRLYSGPAGTDPTVLFVRRVPLFGIFLQNSLPIVRAVLDDEKGRAWYATMLPHLDQEGKETLNTWLAKNFASMTSATPASA